MAERSLERPGPLLFEEMEEISKRLRQELDRLGASQVEVAAKLVIGRSAVNHWVNAINMPTTAQWVRLAKTFNLSLDYILLGRKSESTPVQALARRIAKLSPDQLDALLKVFGDPATDERVEAAGYKPIKP